MMAAVLLVPARFGRVAVRMLGVAMLVAASACASGRGVTYVGTGPAGPASGAAVLAQARNYTGVAYRNGGASPAGFDCSGFVQYLFAQHGVALPRTAERQFEIGRKIGDRALAAGDLVFFRTNGHRVSHVGVATGTGGFIHAPNARSRVRVDRLDAEYWADRYAGARRIVEP
jgi:cell wall-associated NlpC family hydrolase